MMRPFRPEPEHKGGAFADFRAAYGQHVEHKWAFVLAAVGIPALIITGFAVQYDRDKEYKPPEVIFFKPMKTGRTDAQIRAQQLLDAPAEQAARKAIKDAEDARKAQFRKLADDMGIDVDRR